MIFQRTENAWHFINQGLESMNYDQYKKAIPKFNRAISLEPHNHVAQLHKGRSLYKIGHYENALQCFNLLLKSDPKNLDALLNQGLTCLLYTSDAADEL